jgi:hypothetical protein
MTARRHLLLALLLPALGACNMLISERPMYVDADRASVVPRNGIWLSPNRGCEFDSSQPETAWPDCAMWIVVRKQGDEMHLSDGKKQVEELGGFFAAGEPLIVQARWIDTAKEPRRAYYGFYGVEPHQIGPDGFFSAASIWVVECGTQTNRNADIQPFPGIGPDCHAPSKDLIRSAAQKSRRADVIEEWRWLRAEATVEGN